MSNNDAKYENNHQVQSKTVNPIVDDNFKSIIRGLNFCGTCPIGCEDGASVEFIIGKGSFSMIVCTASGFALTLVCVLNTVDFFSETMILSGFSTSIKALRSSPGKGAGDTTGNIIANLVTFVFVSTVLAQLSGTLINWSQANNLKQFLNNWHVFHEQFDFVFKSCCLPHQNFPKTRYPGLKTFALYFLPFLLFGFLGTVYHSLTVTTRISLSVLPVYIADLSTNVSLVSAELLDDAKVIQMFGCITRAYEMVTAGIESNVRDMNYISEDQVKSWRELIIMIRRQCDLSSQCISQRQLSLVAQAILNTTASLFFLSNIRWQNETYVSMLPIWIFFCVSVLLRTYAKASASEKITKAERELATRIALIKLNRIDIATVQEMKFTHDLVVCDPVAVRFGNYLVFNRRVMLTIMGQVVTYLIVLMQFAQT